MKKNIVILGFLFLIAVTATGQAEPGASTWKTWFIPAGRAYRLPPPGSYKEEVNKVILRQKALDPATKAQIEYWGAMGIYDGFISCWDAKYTYWGTRPDQYDTSFHPVLFNTPPFPGYPSGHAMIDSVMCELYSYLFPSDKSYFQNKAKDGAESRFQGGIHFRTDNEVGLEMGKKVGAAIIQKVKMDGADKKE